ncbi:MAG: hypothetical protein ACRC0A_02420 [Chitinophagaceae bacterium]
MFFSKMLYSFFVGLIFFISQSIFSQKIGYVKINAPTKPNISIAADKMKQIQAEAGDRTLSLAVFFDNSKGLSEDKNQAHICNLFEQKLLTFFDVRDRKEIKEKLVSSPLKELSNNVDFIVVFSDLSFDKNYKVSKYNKKKFAWSEEYNLPEDLGQEYNFKGITLNGKVIRAKDNTLLGSFMLDFVPCSEEQGCSFILKKGGSGPILSNVNTKKILPPEVDLTQDSMDEFITQSASFVAQILKNSIQ